MQKKFAHLLSGTLSAIIQIPPDEDGMFLENRIAISDSPYISITEEYNIMKKAVFYCRVELPGNGGLAE